MGNLCEMCFSILVVKNEISTEIKNPNVIEIKKDKTKNDNDNIDSHMGLPFNSNSNNPISEGTENFNLIGNNKKEENQNNNNIYSNKNNENQIFFNANKVEVKEEKNVLEISRENDD